MRARNSATCVDITKKICLDSKGGRRALGLGLYLGSGMSWMAAI